MRDVVKHVIGTLEGGRQALFCQVVETRGSTPQKAGAVMVVETDGGQVGTLGGGCVENEVKQLAIRQLDRPGARIESYVLDHDDAWADGLICGGKMSIVTEALAGEGPLAYFQALDGALDRGEGFTEAVVVDPGRVPDSAVGRRALFDHEGNLLAGERGLGTRPAPLAERPRARVEQGIAWLPSLPRIRLVIVGAGHVGQAVAALAAETDFDVWVVDDRARFANVERFPAAQRTLVGPIAETLDALDVTPQTYILIVTRGHGHDQEALQHAAPTAAAYVGLIGSKRKIRLIFESLREQGVSDEALARVNAPVGLDIGSRTVPEIAVSIVAELIARRNLGPKAAVPSLGARSR
ncbi:XdhC family protein [Paludisphaera mucosa]|uniref:XdhC family protein n=1 Tax=Paludisphaera mucosa TaxID=3030827 RepID=A0ABT6F5V4_9BACT|nr:XdhC/CoxI family protein [Paludisphaera mucosa]MDG3002894.1 XdhC family protein [Paludisphaera mucosa]